MSARFTMLVGGALAVVASAQAPSMGGVWRTQGYGYVFQIQGVSLKAFEMTAATCVPGFTAEREHTVVLGREATFKTGDGDVFFVRAGGTPDHKVGQNEGSASDVRLDRLPRLPAVCDAPAPNTPMGNFEVFRTPQGTTFDGPGIPPDFVAPVFADEDVAAGKDPEMAKALEVLRASDAPRGARRR